MTDFTINVKLDLEKDARNYRRAFNANTHATKRKEQVATISSIDLQKIIGMSVQDTYPFLREYLENFWKQNEDKAKAKIEEMQIAFDTYKDKIFETMEILTKHPLYINHYTVFLTSLNRGPYDYKRGYTLSYLDWTGVRMAFIHELLHFQTIHYYKEYIMSKLHDEKKFEDLKEALTFVLNYTFKDVIEKPDMGYPQHQDLRKQLETYRLAQPEQERDFEKLIDYGCDLLLK